MDISDWIRGSWNINVCVSFVDISENFRVDPSRLAADHNRLFFVGSIQLIGSGILGLYVQSIFIATKNRPNYIIESVFGFSEKELEHIRKKPTGR